MTDDQGTSSGDPSGQSVTITSAEFPALYSALQCTSADELLQSIGIDPSTISDDNNNLPNV
jgi:hypothetical protein